MRLGPFLFDLILLARWLHPAPVVDETSIHQCYPNPLSGTTTISYAIPIAAEVKLTVVDMLGRQVGLMVLETQQPGTYEVTFYATDLSSGIYFYRLQAGDYVETKQMVVVK